MQIQKNYFMSQILSLPHVQSMNGKILLPGSKSIANRALMLSALSEGTTVLINLPDSDDVKILRKSLPGLGVKTEAIEKNAEASAYEFSEEEPVRWKIHGVGGAFPVNEGLIYLENAGTALRPMTAVICASKGKFTIDGNKAMQKRPIMDLVDSLKKAGIKIDAPTGCPPVSIESEGLPSGVYEVSGKVSSQFLSALLMAGPLSLPGDFEIRVTDELVSKPYIKITTDMMKIFGVEVQIAPDYSRFLIPDGAKYKSPGEYFIEGDASAATYFLAGGSIPGSGPIDVIGIGENSLQGDSGFIHILKEMGAITEIYKNHMRTSGLADGKKLKALDIDMNAMPDAAMTLAVLALYCDGTTHIRNIENLRVKESERIVGLRTELERLGAHVTEERDALHITPPQIIKHAAIETYEDHRMAMAFSLASFGGSVDIIDPDCVSKTYPHYFKDFLRVITSVNN
jgi:3-phosphoshikimate 1-carboxyvinyltransferase